jgi:methyl-accepting chemotaxis protein
MKAASLQVKRNAEEQLQGSRLITKSIENITDMLYSINQAQQEQKKGSSQVVQLMERIKVASQQVGESGRRLADVVNALSQEAVTLRDEIKRFDLLAADDNGPDQNS